MGEMVERNSCFGVVCNKTGVFATYIKHTTAAGNQHQQTMKYYQDILSGKRRKWPCLRVISPDISRWTLWSFFMSAKCQFMLIPC